MQNETESTCNYNFECREEMSPFTEAASHTYTIAQFVVALDGVLFAASARTVFMNTRETNDTLCVFPNEQSVFRFLRVLSITATVTLVYRQGVGILPAYDKYCCTFPGGGIVYVLIFASQSNNNSLLRSANWFTSDRNCGTVFDIDCLSTSSLLSRSMLTLTANVSPSDVPGADLFYVKSRVDNRLFCVRDSAVFINRYTLAWMLQRAYLLICRGYIMDNFFGSYYPNEFMCILVNKYKNVKNQDVLKSKKLGPQTKCPISCETFAPDDPCVTLNCGHIFSHNGIMEMLENDRARGALCPMCRCPILVHAPCPFVPVS